MIVRVIDLGEEGNPRIEFQTEGCSCCSTTLYPDNVEEIMKELMEHTKIVKEVCKILGWDTKEFLS